MDDAPFARQPIKRRDAGRDQQRKRREDVLARQKAKRAESLAQSRGLATPSSTAEPEGGNAFASSDAMHGVHMDATTTTAAIAAVTASAIFSPALSSTEPSASGFNSKVSPSLPFAQMDTGGIPKAKASPADALMTAEWLVDVPADLGSGCWYVAPRPAGRRCLVVAANGVTRAHGRSGGKPRSFPSALPSGSRASRCGLVKCELDCIFSEEQQIYFVLDLLSWKDQTLADCPSEFRLFWLQTKLAEARASVASSSNPCRFVPLPYQLCTPASLQQAYRADVGASPEAMPVDANREGGDAPAAPGGAARRDGILLLHREALYEAGPSPLLLSWADASCSSRFYDYGSTQMEDAIGRDPSKAQRWRTDECHSACSFGELLERAEQPSMDLEGADA